MEIVEGILVTRYPITKNGNKMVRQLQYKLKDGEASRTFKIDKTLEF